MKERADLIKFLKEQGIHTVFHYLSLHKSSFYKEKYPENIDLPMSDLYTDRLLRLPMFYELEENQIGYICSEISKFYM